MPLPAPTLETVGYRLGLAVRRLGASTQWWPAREPLLSIAYAFKSRHPLKFGLLRSVSGTGKNMRAP
jgi:hypothetical protein